ncbi:peptidase S28 [Nemania abortiva]|nr:peptidase S28 [Nemania abortiva]
MVLLAHFMLHAAHLVAFAAAMGNAVDEMCDYKLMTQSIDHFGRNNNTFPQRYSIFTDHFRPGGPILLFQGEESTFLDCANTTVMMWFAEKLGGMAVSLEHRYFGQSLPFANNSYSNENFKFLTLDNVMADAVSFVEMLQKTIPGAQSSKSIVASGSYGGLLATAFRQNHPATFFGSIAAAGPTLAATAASPTIEPDQFLWRSYGSQAYMDRSKEASTKIKDALNYIQSVIESGNTTTLQQELQLCTAPPKNSLLSIITIQQLYVAGFSGAVEFNYASARPGRTYIARPFDRVIDIALKAETPTQLLNSSLWLWYEPQGYKCIDWADPTFAQKSTPLIQWAPWSYITCTYVPLCTTDALEGTIFPPLEGSCSTRSESCAQKYNATLLTQEQFWGDYHLSTEELNNSTRIIFSVAEYDPTTAVVGANPPLTADPCRSRRLYASDMAHREELFYPTDGDKPEVVSLRNKELEIMKEWLENCG